MPPEEVNELKREIAELKKEVEDLKRSISELVEAWKMATGLVRFIKWLAGLAISLTILWQFVMNMKPSK